MNAADPNPTLNLNPLLARPHIVKLRPPQNEPEAAALNATVDRLHAAAAADNHAVLNPTHVVLKGEAIVGYGSLAGLPTLHLWVDSKRVNAMESMRLLETTEVLLAEGGCRAVCVPCSEESPFYAHMERLGYTKLGRTVLFVKNVGTLPAPSEIVNPV